MADLKIKYGTPAALTCTVANLTTGAARISDVQDNTSTLAIDALLNVTIGLTTGATTGNDNAVYIYLYGSQDGVRFSDNVSGGDGAFSAFRATNNLRGPFTINFATATGAPIANAIIGSVATFFGGVMPNKWGIVVQNKTNILLTTATNMTASYTPIFLQSV